MRIRLPSDKERMKKIRKMGGLDDGFVDKKYLKSLEGLYTCKFCQEPMYPIPMLDKGKIIMSCRTPDCAGNWNLKRSEWREQHREVVGRQLDKELVFDLKKAMYFRHPDRLWADRFRFMHI